MKKSFLRHIWNAEYVLSSILVMGLVYLMGVISSLLPEADETSFLNPIFDRIDFLNIEDVSLDAIFAMKPSGFPDKRIVVINVGEVAPAPDGKIAAAVRRAHEYGARVIGIDVIFDVLHFERFPEDRKWEKDSLTGAFADVPNVVVVNGYNIETMKPAFQIDPAVRKNIRYYGYASLEKDDDGVVRRFLPYRTIQNERWLSFPARIMEVYNSKLVEPLLRLPEEPQIIYYKATHNQFQGQTLPIDDVVNHPPVLAEFYRKIFKDAIVLIGFVNEGGMWYPEDTHKTPMGKKITITDRDGASRMGMEGPDMSGLLIHANAIDMMLSEEFIAPVPAWGDWLLVFLLSYISIALYRVVRIKPVNRGGIGALITFILAVESLMVFFLPIIAFFNFDIKISYNLMATAVVLFIPANAIVMKWHVKILSWKSKRTARKHPSPANTVIEKAFEDDESFPLYVRIIHASLYTVHYALAVHHALHGSTVAGVPRKPAIDDWTAAIEQLHSLSLSDLKKDVRQMLFYRYLDGMKDRFLRDSYMKDFFFHTELAQHNPHHFFDDWEILLPHVVRMARTDLKYYCDCEAQYRESAADGGENEAAGTSSPLSGIQLLERRLSASYCHPPEDRQKLTKISPFCIYTECKLHRKEEWFVFAAFVPKQFGMRETPVYYGETAACEPVLAAGAIEELNTYCQQEQHVIYPQEQK